jgi:5'-deoxynucleotidase YfbR-like HD superfamily hydrolase
MPAERARSCTIPTMSVPGRVAAASLLLSLDPPTWFLRHSRVVAEIAGWLALRAARRGAAVDRPLVEAAALLHDADKLLPRGDPAARLPHGEGSGAWLAVRGFEELAPAASAHPVTRLLDLAWFERWLADAPLEERIVAYADKRAGQRLESLADRFESWLRRFPPIEDDGTGTEAAWTASAVRAIMARAAALESDVCRAIAISATDVGRLRWTDVALRAARRGIPSPHDARVPSPSLRGPAEREPASAASVGP